MEERDAEQYEEIPDSAQSDFDQELSGGTSTGSDEPLALDAEGSLGESIEGEGQPPKVTPQPQAEPWKERYEALERRQAQLEANLRRQAEDRFPPGGALTPPKALSKHPSQWTPDELWEVNQFMVRQELSRATAENDWRGRLNAKEMGEGKDYDSLVDKYLYNNPSVATDQQTTNFIRQLPAPDRYMLALMHEIHEASGGDIIKAAQTIRNALAARTDAVKEIQKSVDSAARKTALKVFRGGQPQGSTGKQNWWDMSDIEFTRLARSKGA